MPTMMISALATGMPWNERFSLAGIVTLQGMLTIFLVLALLWGAIEVMHSLLAKDSKTEKEPAPAKKIAPVVEETTFEAETELFSAEGSDDGALVAAITAAISAMRAEEGCTGGFRVVSFKRASSASVRRNRF